MCAWSECTHLGSQHVGHHVSIKGEVDKQLETLQTEWGVVCGVQERVQLLQKACVVTVVSLVGRQVSQRLQRGQSHALRDAFRHEEVRKDRDAALETNNDFSESVCACDSIHNVHGS